MFQIIPYLQPLAVIGAPFASLYNCCQADSNNCLYSYFAWKECTYTDSAGRSVPAPNANRQEGSATHNRYGANTHSDLGSPDATLAYASQRGPVLSNSYVHSNVPYGPGGFQPPFGSTSGTAVTSPITGQPTRKRLRDERDMNQYYDQHYNSSAQPSGLPMNDSGPSTTGPSMENSYLRSTNTTVAPDAYHGIDRSMIRELVNRKHMPHFSLPFYLQRIVSVSTFRHDFTLIHFSYIGKTIWHHKSSLRRICFL